MTTSYILERQQELRDMKRLARQAEAAAMEAAASEAEAKRLANEHRIAVKMARINGEPEPEAPVLPEPVVEAVAEPEPRSRTRTRAEGCSQKTNQKGSGQKGSCQKTCN